MSIVKDHQTCNSQRPYELLLWDGFDPRKDGRFCSSNTSKKEGKLRRLLAFLSRNTQLLPPKILKN